MFWHLRLILFTRRWSKICISTKNFWQKLVTFLIFVYNSTKSDMIDESLNIVLGFYYLNITNHLQQPYRMNHVNLALCSYWKINDPKGGKDNTLYPKFKFRNNILLFPYEFLLTSILMRNVFYLLGIFSNWGISKHIFSWIRVMSS